jgi:hypothetical protein
MNHLSPAFVAAFGAGLASPVSLYATTLYTPQIVGYNVGTSFAQVGVTLTQLSAPAYYGRESKSERTASIPERSTG